jgi:hypothetical protein
MAMLELILLIAAIFGAGFASGFAVRAYISRQRHHQARKQDDDSFALRFNPVSDAPRISPAMPELPIAAAQSKPHRASATATSPRAR